MSITDAARHLKLSLAQVQALEAGAYERLPGRVFVRGFLINYAKLLGLDPQPLLLTIDHEMPQALLVDEAPQSTRAVMPREEAGRWPTYLAITAALIVGLLAVYEFGFNEPPPQDSPAPETNAERTGAASSGAKAPAATAVEGIRLTQDSTVSRAPHAPVLQPPAAASEAAAESSSALTGEPAATVGPASTVSAGQRLLHFRFEQDSWVEVRDRSDKIIFAKLNKSGSSERVIGTPPFKLVVGNARGVRLDYDDTAVDLAPTQPSMSTARLTLQ
jgi:cytoskeleton protein RodZ